MRTFNVAELTDCIAPLDGEQRKAVREYWERVIREEWTPPQTRRTAGPDATGELAERRARRETRRAMARIARAARPSVAVSPIEGEAA